MVNTLARAHVASPVPIPTSVADLEFHIEKYQTNDEEQTSDSAQLLSRKERRKQKKYISRLEELASSESERSSPAQTTTTSDDDSDELSDESARLSRKQRRKLKKRKDPSDSPRRSESRKPPRPNSLPQSHEPTLLINPSMPSPTYYPLLVCSIGNPGTQYANTLHSAGHTLLDTIRNRGLYNPFRAGLSGRVATPNTTRFKYTIFGYEKDTSNFKLAAGEDDFTLWQSTKLMNVSGPAVRSAWREFSAQQRSKGMEGRLVVVHDELEATLGKVSVKEGTASPKGHNGLKSVQASMGGTTWWRIGVGIGRPESREPAVVSRYVLRKMTYGEEKAIDGASVPVLYALRQIAEGKV